MITKQAKQNAVVEKQTVSKNETAAKDKAKKAAAKATAVAKRVTVAAAAAETKKQAETVGRLEGEVAVLTKSLREATDQLRVATSLIWPQFGHLGPWAGGGRQEGTRVLPEGR